MRDLVIWTCWLMGIISLIACQSPSPKTPAQSPPPQEVIKVGDSVAIQPLPTPTPLLVGPEGFQRIDWDLLGEVSFEEKFYPDIQAYLLYPSFGQAIKDMEGKAVFISGYVIPIEPGRFVLSRYSFASCFFCGGAGPETVLELDLKDKEALYENDEYRTFQGFLRTNDSDIDRLNYIIEQAEPIDPDDRD